MDAAVGIVDGGIERAGGNQSRQRRKLFIETVRGDNCLAGVCVFRRQIKHQLQRVCIVRKIGCDGDDSFGELFHGEFCLVAAQLRRRPGPDISDRHTAEAGRMFAAMSFDGHLDIDQVSFVDNSTTKFERGSE